MNIHEYQAKELLAGFGVPVPAGVAALTVEEAGGRREAARAAVRRQGADPRRRPRQGQVQGTRPRRQGRRAPGQDRSTRSRANAKEMLGNTLVTIQTGEAGKQVNRLYVTDGVDIAKEFYLSHAGRPRDRPHRHRRLDRGRHGHRGRSPTTRPRRSPRITIDPATGFMPHHGRAVAFALKLTGDLAKQAQATVGQALRRLRRHRHGRC